MCCTLWRCVADADWCLASGGAVSELGAAGLHGARIEIEIALDGGRDPQVDPLMGECDLDTDGTEIGGWAGLNGHVAIECRPAVFLDGGVGNVVPPHVQHPPVTAASAGRPLELSVSFVVSGGSAPAAVDVFYNASGTLVAVGSATSAGDVTGEVSLAVTVPAVRLWSPEERSLYTAVVRLGPAGAAVDTASARFGVRTVVADGHKLMLNGNRLYLAGYGDDSVYPLTVACTERENSRHQPGRCLATFLQPPPLPSHSLPASSPFLPAPRLGRAPYAPR